MAPVPGKPLVWTGILFVRKGEACISGNRAPPCARAPDAHAQFPGPYANAVLRFHVDFPIDYPSKPPVLRFLSDLFHPLVTPLTTYTHSSRDTGSDTVSAADENRLPPGGLSLRHGFPEWFQLGGRDVAARTEAQARGQGTQSDHQLVTEHGQQGTFRPPHIAEVLQYLRIVFDTEAVLDAVPLEAAGNTGAWHAWRTFRSKASSSSRAASVARPLGGAEAESRQERSASPQQRQQQPGGARRPGEWNWQGVWEERVRRSVQASQSEAMLFGGDNNDVVRFTASSRDGALMLTCSKISFLKLDQETLGEISPFRIHEPLAATST